MIADLNWDKFTHSGRIEDYLQYVQGVAQAQNAVQNTEQQLAEEQKYNANNGAGLGYQGKK